MEQIKRRKESEVLRDIEQYINTKTSRTLNKSDGLKPKGKEEILGSITAIEKV